MGLGGRKSTHMESNSNRSFLGTAPDSGYGSVAHAHPLDYHNYQADTNKYGMGLDAMDQGDQSSLLNGSYHTQQDYAGVNSSASAMDPDDAMNYLQGGNVWGSYDGHPFGFGSSFMPYQMPSHSPWTSTDMSSLALHQPPQAWQTAMMTPPAESYDLGHSYQPKTPMGPFKHSAEIQTDTSGYVFPQHDGQRDMFIPDTHLNAVKLEVNALHSCPGSSPATPASYVATPNSSRMSSLPYRFSEDRPQDEVVVPESSVGDEACASTTSYPDLPGSSPTSAGSNVTPNLDAAKPDKGQEISHVEPKSTTGSTTNTTVKERRVRAPRPPGSNRAAAKKCREKTKNNEKELEFRERNMGTLNMLLKRELEQVVREAVEWRTRLLAHAHCDNPSINNWINARAVEISETVSSASTQTSSEARTQSMSPSMGSTLRLQSLELRHDRHLQPQFRASQPVEEALNQCQGPSAAPDG